MSAHSPRIAFVTALICVGLLSAAFYLEFISGLVPCALCLAQRAMFALICIACLLYLLPFYGSRLIFGLLSFVSSGLGIWLASRQLWLQSLPEDQLPACGPDIYFILERFPILDGLKTMFLDQEIALRCNGYFSTYPSPDGHCYFTFSPHRSRFG